MTNFNAIEKDINERQKALDPSLSFIVQAPAGSGKTELLIQRFLTLLCYVQSPEEILAITFTKKAANEMRLRVLQALKFADSTPEPESDHKKQTWRLAKQVLQRDQQLNWCLLNNPNQLHIQTIDSLCSYLTKQLPLLSRMGSAPDISINPMPLYREAIVEVLTNVENEDEWSDAISEILLHLDNDFNKLHELLVNLLAKRDQWLPYIHLDTSDSAIQQALEEQIGMIISDALDNVIKLTTQINVSELLAIARFTSNHLKIRNILQHDCLPGNKPSDLEKWRELAKLLLTSTHTYRKRVDEKIGFPPLKDLKNPQEKATHQTFRDRYKHFIEQISHRDDLRLALADLFYLPNPIYQTTQWSVLKALLTVLKLTAAQLRLVFKKHGAIDFIENSQASLLALGSDEQPTDLSLALDYSLQHILVDEFQDTSYTQYQLLEKLTAGWMQQDRRTLFVVGDPMQSIYRFREAEVGLFIRMRERGIGQIKLNPITLTRNFRSTNTLVEWNNSHFQHIFPSFTDIATGAVNYTASTTATEITSPDSWIEIKGFEKSDLNLQVNQIVQQIKTLKENYPNDNIAILVRSRTHLQTIIPGLRREKIDYRAVDIDPLVSRPIIQDLLSLTKALSHPADRIAWLSILRAPWCGLSLADLFILTNENPYTPIIECLENLAILERLSVDGLQRIKRVAPILKTNLLHRLRVTHREWIENCWFALGGPAALLNDADKEDADAFFKLLESLNQQQLEIQALNDKIQLLYAASSLNESSLQIMTIHSAKGLEFDTVILPHLERKLPPDDKPLLSWMERPLAKNKMALLLAPIHATGAENDPMYDYIQRQEKIKSHYETDRLFYVATTRAKKRLLLYFNAEKKADGEIKIESGSFLEKFLPLLPATQHILAQRSIATDAAETESVNKTLIRRLTLDWVNPLPAIELTQANIHQQAAGFQFTTNNAKIIGLAVHTIMQNLARFGIEWWKNLSDNQKMVFIKAQLHQHCLPFDSLISCQKRIMEIIARVLIDPKAQWILHPHLQSQSELPITTHIDSQMVKLVIDRTFVDNGLRWIIDYKTSEPKTTDLATFLQSEKKKYLPQLQQYAKALQQIDEPPIRLGLYFPAIPSWIET